MDDFVEEVGRVKSLEDIYLFEDIVAQYDLKFDDQLLGYLEEQLCSSYKDEKLLVIMNLVVISFKRCLEVNYVSTSWSNTVGKITNIATIFFTNVLHYIGSPFAQMEAFSQLLIEAMTLFWSMARMDTKLAEGLLKEISGAMFSIVTGEGFSIIIRKTALFAFSAHLLKAKQELKKAVMRANISYVPDLLNWMVTCGDFEVQEKVVEVCAKLSSMFKHKLLQLSFWLKNYPKIADAICQLNIKNFYMSCRVFLNIVNTQELSKMQVISVPCLMVFVEDKELNKPEDKLYKEFWADFSVATGNIHVMYGVTNELWSKISVSQDNVKAIKSSNKHLNKQGNTVSCKELLVIFHDALSVHLLPSDVLASSIKLLLPEDSNFERVHSLFLKVCYTGLFSGGDFEGEDSGLIYVNTKVKSTYSSYINLDDKKKVSLFDSTISSIRSGLTDRIRDSGIEMVSKNKCKGYTSTPLKRPILAEPKMKLFTSLKDSESKHTSENKSKGFSWSSNYYFGLNVPEGAKLKDTGRLASIHCSSAESQKLHDHPLYQQSLALRSGTESFRMSYVGASVPRGLSLNKNKSRKVEHHNLTDDQIVYSKADMDPVSSRKHTYESGASSDTSHRKLNATSIEHLSMPEKMVEMRGNDLKYADEEKCTHEGPNHRKVEILKPSNLKSIVEDPPVQQTVESSKKNQVKGFLDIQKTFVDDSTLKKTTFGEILSQSKSGFCQNLTKPLTLESVDILSKNNKVKKSLGLSNAPLDDCHDEVKQGTILRPSKFGLIVKHSTTLPPTDSAYRQMENVDSLGLESLGKSPLVGGSKQKCVDEYLSSQTESLELSTDIDRRKPRAGKATRLSKSDTVTEKFPLNLVSDSKEKCASKELKKDVQTVSSSRVAAKMEELEGNIESMNGELPLRSVDDSKHNQLAKYSVDLSASSNDQKTTCSTDFGCKVNKTYGKLIDPLTQNLVNRNQSIKETLSKVVANFTHRSCAEAKELGRSEGMVQPSINVGAERSSLPASNTSGTLKGTKNKCSFSSTSLKKPLQEDNKKPSVKSTEGPSEIISKISENEEPFGKIKGDGTEGEETAENQQNKIRIDEKEESSGKPRTIVDDEPQYIKFKVKSAELNRSEYPSHVARDNRNDEIDPFQCLIDSRSEEEAGAVRESVESVLKPMKTYNRKRDKARRSAAKKTYLQVQIERIKTPENPVTIAPTGATSSSKKRKLFTPTGNELTKRNNITDEPTTTPKNRERTIYSDLESNRSSGGDHLFFANSKDQLSTHAPSQPHHLLFCDLSDTGSADSDTTKGTAAKSSSTTTTKDRSKSGNGEVGGRRTGLRERHRLPNYKEPSTDDEAVEAEKDEESSKNKGNNKDSREKKEKSDEEVENAETNMRVFDCLRKNLEMDTSLVQSANSRNPCFPIIKQEKKVKAGNEVQKEKSRSSYGVTRPTENKIDIKSLNITKAKCKYNSRHESIEKIINNLKGSVAEIIKKTETSLSVVKREIVACIGKLENVMTAIEKHQSDIVNSQEALVLMADTYIDSLKEDY